MTYKIENPALEKKWLRKWKQDAKLRDEFTLDDTDEKGLSRYLAYMDAAEKGLITLHYSKDVSLKQIITFLTSSSCQDLPEFKNNPGIINIARQRLGESGGSNKQGHEGAIKQTIRHIHDKADLYNLTPAEAGRRIVELFKGDDSDYRHYYEPDDSDYFNEYEDICIAPIRDVVWNDDKEVFYYRETRKIGTKMDIEKPLPPRRIRTIIDGIRK